MMKTEQASVEPPDATDLAKSPRVSGKGVDIGCYELFAPAGLNIVIR